MTSLTTALGKPGATVVVVVLLLVLAGLAFAGVTIPDPLGWAVAALLGLNLYGRTPAGTSAEGEAGA